MASKEHEKIQAFLRKFQDPKVNAESLGLSVRLAELFWTALAAVPEEGGLAIPGFAKTAKKLGFQSSYLTELKKRKLLKPSGEWGGWMITKKAMKAIDQLLKGDKSASAADQPKKTAGKKKGTKKKSTKRRKSKKTVKKTAKRAGKKARTSPAASPISKNISEIKSYLAELRNDIEAKQHEEAEIIKSLAQLTK